MAPSQSDLIITAASEFYRRQLLALIGSLNCNWPNHPKVLVYDIGLSSKTLAVLQAARVEVRKVPEFCAHWRKHYTWKFWCWNDAPAGCVLWLDAGCCVLRPLPEMFEIARHQGYFAIPNYRPLELEASEEGCEGCGVSPDFRKGKGTVASGIFAFSRDGHMERLIEECLQVAMVERNIKAFDPAHRPDQQVLSLLMYRDLHPLILGDGTIYAFANLNAVFSLHAIWAARRNMHPGDLEYFARYANHPGPPHLPRQSHKLTWWYRFAWLAYRTVMTVCGRGGQWRPVDGIRDRGPGEAPHGGEQCS